jgi:hypothetical protein
MYFLPFPFGKNFRVYFVVNGIWSWWTCYYRLVVNILLIKLSIIVSVILKGLLESAQLVRTFLKGCENISVKVVCR